MTKRTKPCVRCGMTFRIGKPAKSKPDKYLCNNPRCTTSHGSARLGTGKEVVPWVDDETQVETSMAS